MNLSTHLHVIPRLRMSGVTPPFPTHRSTWSKMLTALYSKQLYCIVLYCGRVPAANAPGCTAAEGLLYKPWSLVVPTCTARCLLGREMADEFCLKMPDFHVTFRDLLHAVNIRHGTNGFTSLPKEGVLRIFSLRKIRWLRPGLNRELG